MSATSRPLNVLVVQSSGRLNGSTTRALSAQLLDKMQSKIGRLNIVERELTEGVPFVDDAWINANFTPPEERSAHQSATLGYSDTLVEELENADVVVIGAPIYNFGVPAVLKAWIDQIARARRTFLYTDKGPKGLLTGKTAIVVTASGGTTQGSEVDFAIRYLRHVLGFIGIDDVKLVDSGGQSIDADAARNRAADDLAKTVDYLFATRLSTA